MGYLLYILYTSNLEKFRKESKDSIFYKSKIMNTKFSLCCVLIVLALLTIDSVWEALQLLMK